MKIAYWCTSSLEPDHEAVSSEIFRLARRFPPSWILSVSPHFWIRFSSKKRYAGIHPGMYVLARMLIPALERGFDLNHVYGDLTPWVFHRSLKSRPIVHTVTQAITQPVAGFLNRCSAIVVQSRATYTALTALGVSEKRLFLWYPGVDLLKFRPNPSARPTVHAPRLLFAAAPRSKEELEGRGVNLLLETAKRYPGLSFQLLYRSWRGGYTSVGPTVEAIEAAALTNVRLENGTVEDMASVYSQNHFTVIPFLDAAGGKECPNSAIESLACAVPVLVSAACPFADFVHENRCGLVFDPEPGALAKAVEQGMRDWGALSRAARLTAERYFSFEDLRSRYADLYGKMC